MSCLSLLSQTAKVRSNVWEAPPLWACGSGHAGRKMRYSTVSTLCCRARTRPMVTPLCTAFAHFTGAQLHIDGQVSPLRPVLLFDDGQELAASQRNLLLDAFHDRELRLARWYTERYSAMEPEDLVGDGEPQRNSVPVSIEREALRMGAATRRGIETASVRKAVGRHRGPTRQPTTARVRRCRPAVHRTARCRRRPSAADRRAGRAATRQFVNVWRFSRVPVTATGVGSPQQTGSTRSSQPAVGASWKSLSPATVTALRLDSSRSS